MEKIFRVKTENGYKEFKEETEANAYEAEIKSKELKEELERKEFDTKKASLKEQIKVKSKELDALFDSYEKLTGRRYTYYNKDFQDINLQRLLNGFVDGWWF